MSKKGKMLIQAARSGDLNALSAAIWSEKRFGMRSVWGGEAVAMAAEWGQVECLEALLSAGAEANEPDSNGMTAVMMAASAGRAQCLAILARSGADVEACDYGWGRTALMWAAWKGNAECVEALLGAGAKLRTKGAAGVVAMDFCKPGSSCRAVLEAAELRASTPAAVAPARAARL